LPGLDEANLKVSWPEKRTEEGWRSSNKNYLVSSDLTYINLIQYNGIGRFRI
jgi:hypothetical protein